MSAILTLILGLIILSFLVFFLFPDTGLLAKMLTAFREVKKVNTENALKFLFDLEYKNSLCTAQVLSGALRLNIDKTYVLISDLEQKELVKTEREFIKLTESGRDYALKVIRVHRIWERYLADETGMNHLDWHSSAEDVEHILSLEEANKIAAKMGNPLYDPHGDPIPSIDGIMPQYQSVALNDLEAGESAVITHIEDEPASIFAQISAYGLKRGEVIRLIEKNNSRVKFLFGEEECVLAPIFAANISVEKSTSTIETKPEKNHLLTQLKQGEIATVVGISKGMRGQQKRRLMDFGIVPGSEIKLELVSTFGEPKAYLIRGALVAIRTNQIEQIYISDIRKESKKGA